MIIDILICDKGNVSVSCQNLLTKQMLDMSLPHPNVSATPVNIYMPLTVDPTFPGCYSINIDNDPSIPDGYYVCRYHQNGITFDASFPLVIGGKSELANTVKSYKFSVR